MKVRGLSAVGFILLMVLAAAAPALAQSGAWTTKAPLLIPSPGARGAVVNDIFYLIRPIAYSYRNDQSLYAYHPLTDQWMERFPMPTKRNVFGVGVVNGIIYAAGGWNFNTSTLYKVLEAYNPNTDSWESKAPMLIARANLAGAGVNGIFYAIGGSTPGGRLSTVEAYDPQTNTWTTKADMLAPRDNFGVGVINGKIYAVGGNTGSSEYSTRLEVYDPAADTWTSKASMPTARNYPAVEVIDGILYVMGGHDGVNYLNTVEAYSPQTNTWYTLDSMPTPRAGAAAGAISGVIYVAGGANETGGVYTPLDANEAFRPQNLAPVANAGLMQVVEVGTTATLDGSKSTDPEGAPLTYNWSFFLKPDGSAATLINPTSVNPRFTPDQVGQYLLQLIVTDNQGLPSALATVTIWGVPKVWNYTGSMNQARWQSRPCVLQDGRVLVAGGFTAITFAPNGNPGPSGPTLTSELYDPKTSTWTPTGDLKYDPIGSPRPLLLPDGRVFLCGGMTANTSRPDVQIYDPATELWTLAKSMLEGRNGHQVILLNTGKVLVVGGQQWRTVTNPDGSTSGRWYQTPSAELYDPATNTWTATGSMAYGRTGHSAGMLPNGRVLVTGGVGVPATDPQWWMPQTLSATEIYDPATGTWSPGADLIPARSPGGRMQPLADGRLMVIGGSAPGSPILGDVQIYDPKTGAWCPTGSLNQPRMPFGQGLLPDGKVLVFGGWGGGKPLNTSEIYDPVSGTWSFTGNLNQTRFFSPNVVMADGRVLVTGGSDGAQVLSSAEVYGPPVITVAIDIKPGSFPNSINLGSRGVVPVAILSSPTFDARMVDPATVTLAGAHVALKGKGTLMTAVQDVNGDGLPDLIVHVDTQALQISATDTKAVLEAKTYDGKLIRGEDTVKIVP